MIDAEPDPDEDATRPSGDARGEPPDGELVPRVLAGEPEAFVTLFERHGDRVHRFLLLRTGDEALAEDLMQDVFERALRSLPSLREPERFRAGLMRIARNGLASHWERRARRPESDDPIPPELQGPASERPERALEPAWRLQALRLRHLPEREQQILALRFGAELSLREAAEQLGCSMAAARQLQYRALTRLRAIADRESAS